MDYRHNTISCPSRSLWDKYFSSRLETYEREGRDRAVFFDQRRVARILGKFNLLRNFRSGDFGFVAPRAAVLRDWVPSPEEDLPSMEVNKDVLVALLKRVGQFYFCYQEDDEQEVTIFGRVVFGQLGYIPVDLVEVVEPVRVVYKENQGVLSISYPLWKFNMGGTLQSAREIVYLD